MVMLLCKDNANERNENLFSDCRVQLIYAKISIQRTNINGNFFQKTCKSYQKPCNFSYMPKYNMKYNKIRVVFFVFVIVLLSCANRG